MNEYQVSDYGIFSDAISTTKSLNDSINNFKTSLSEVKNSIDNDAVFMGPIADECATQITNLDNIASTMVGNFTSISTYLSEASEKYKAGDTDASSVQLRLTDTNGTGIQVTASAYQNPANISGSHLDFINQIKDGAVASYNKYGVLPSLTMAQAILESGWGEHPIGKNLFGIKAGSSWTGKTKTTETGEQRADGSRYKTTATFRDYDSYSESIDDHAKLLTNERYKGVIASKNYKEACKAVKDAGYATSLDYTKNLINIIEKYGLDQWDPKTT